MSCAARRRAPPSSPSRLAPPRASSPIRGERDGADGGVLGLFGRGLLGIGRALRAGDAAGRLLDDAAASAWPTPCALAPPRRAPWRSRASRRLSASVLRRASALAAFASARPSPPRASSSGTRRDAPRPARGGVSIFGLSMSGLKDGRSALAGDLRAVGLRSVVPSGRWGHRPGPARLGLGLRLRLWLRLRLRLPALHLSSVLSLSVNGAELPSLRCTARAPKDGRLERIVLELDRPELVDSAGAPRRPRPLSNRGVPNAHLETVDGTRAPTRGGAQSQARTQFVVAAAPCLPRWTRSTLISPPSTN